MGWTGTRLSGVDALVALTMAAVVAAAASMLLRDRPLQVWYDLWLFHNGPAAVVLAWMSVLVLRRAPGRAGGLVLLAIAVVSAGHVAVAAVADARLVAAGIATPLGELPDLTPADLPLDASVPLWLMNWLWVPAAVLCVTVLPLVFPDGRLPPRPWRVLAPATIGVALLVAGFAVDAWPTSAWPVDDATTLPSLLVLAGGAAVLLAAVGGFAGLARRWRRAGADDRRRYEAAGLVAAALGTLGVATYPWQRVWVPVTLLGVNALVIAYSLTIARYGLHDIEPVLGRAAVAATVSLVVAALYVGIVVGAGSLIGRRVDSTALALLAVALVALLVEPTRRRVRVRVDRLLYRREADRTEVLSQIAAQASAAPGAAEMAGEVVQLLVRSTGAAGAEARLHGAVVASAGRVGAHDVAARAEVVVDDEAVGDLRLHARAAADLTSDAADLLEDTAHAIAVAARGDRLATELRDRLGELEASRRRLVEAEHEARTRLERDIHDGAQARLIALRLRIGLLKATAAPGLAAQLDELAADVDAAVRSLRELGRGLHPPALAQAGVAGALRAHARISPIPVSVTADGVGRQSAAVEGAVYFSCLEALQNAVRHGAATRVAVDLAEDGGELRFAVRDDGRGFDPQTARRGAGLANIADRVGALGGRMEVRSAPGSGAEVRGAVPAQPLSGAER